MPSPSWAVSSGDAAFSPVFHSVFSNYFSPELSEQLSFILSFSLVTGLFILFADLTPKRIGMIAPEAVALRIINPMRFCLFVFRPLVWFFKRPGKHHLPPVQAADGTLKTTSPLMMSTRCSKPVRWQGCCVSRSMS
ncbi:Putative Mg2+ and Co2+ transporter CorB [Leclercia adecarboxylata]|uniref:Mg2+ and Co2+ transporter CorB n=1 Tax=Leclercia adecarboxylata TaxID=83655 RepID=A0A4V6JHI3_9ENTR|nr:Putative Mg2+ and Co2+ transporter CorB [Leclercia adecarboxylata]